jgi:deazaflavin-dependent oxidoreductase (nitroreductase family)
MNATLAKRLARVADTSTLRLTHYGRKSGKPYEVTIWFLVEGDTVFLVTSNVQRQWTRNVQKRSKVSLHIDGETFEGTASRITAVAERAHVNELVGQKYWYVRPLLWLVETFGLPDHGGAFRVRLRTQ